jgi:hypothetical protein
MKISLLKSKARRVCGKNIQRVKMEIEGTIVVQASDFITREI